MGALKITGQSAEPTVTASDAGTIYYDSDTNKLRHYNGTAWADVSGALTSEDLPAGSVLQIVGHEDNTVSTPSDTGAVSIVSKAITTKGTDSHFLLLGQTNFGFGSGSPNVRAYFRRCLPSVAFASGNDLGAFTDGNKEGGIGGSDVSNHNGLEELSNIAIDWIDSSASYTVGDIITYHFVIGVRDTSAIINRIGHTSDNNWVTRTYTTIRILEIGQ